MKAFILFALIAVGGPALAQQHQPYTGEHHRAIKALSSAEITQYLSGAGMGYAKAAELNQYPGPMHALELASELDLSAEQRASLESLMKRHKAEARVLGAEVVRLERELDALFAQKHATADSIDDVLAQLSVAQGRYRGAHLKTHVEAARLLTADQIARYDVLRGYGDNRSPVHRHGGSQGR
jgi:Spy/CpxP family protein refolding chaperone